MHIIHVVIHFPTTKLEYQEVALARQQIKEGHKVTIITSDWHNNYANYDLIYKPIIGKRHVGTGEFLEEGINIKRLKLKKFFFSIPYLKQLKRKLQAEKPDLIICHGFEVGVLPLQSFIKDVPLIVDSHYMGVYDSQKISDTWKIKRFFKSVIENFVQFGIGMYLNNKSNVKFFGVTEESVQNIIERGRIRKDKVFLIPLGANLEFFYPSTELRQDVRKELGVSQEEILLCYTGKIESYKGVHLIIEALNILREYPLKLIIVGAGSEEYKKQLSDIIEKYLLTDKITFKAFSNKIGLNQVFNAADIAVYPKHVSISHIEAMATGLPVIIEDLKGVQHRISYNNGLCVESGNVSDLVEKIKYFVEDSKRMKLMGGKSLRLVQNSFNWSSINRKILKMIDL